MIIELNICTVKRFFKASIKMTEDKNKLPNVANQDEGPKLISKKVSLVLKQFGSDRERKDGKRKLVGKLIKSNTEVEEKLKLLKSSANCKKDTVQAQSTINLVKEMEELDNHLKTEKAFIADLEKQTNQLTVQRLEVLKQQLKSKRRSSQIQIDQAKTEKSKEILEEKAYAVSVQLSNEIKKNSELREKIRSLMIERKKFNLEYNNILEKLKKGQTVLADLFASVKNAGLTRQNIVNKIEKIAKKEKDQIKIQKEEACNLEMRMDSEEQWRTFYQIKTKTREKLNKSGRRSAHKRESIMNELRNNKELIKEILQFYGKSDDGWHPDSDDVVELIKRDSIEMWALFNYVTQLRHELEVMREKVTNLMNSTEEKLLEQDEMNYYHEHELDYLEGRKLKVEDLIFTKADEVKNGTRLLNRLFTGIENLVTISKTDTSPVVRLLGPNSEVTTFNYNLFLQALESKIMSLMEITDFSKFTLDSFNVSQLTSEKHPRSIKGEDWNGPILKDRITISKPCLQCYPNKQERKSSD